MRVLVVHASRHGATAGIAERVGAALSDAGMQVDVHPAADAAIIGRADQLGRYDAFVVGSAIYAFHWLGEAKDFVRQFAPALRTRPVWLFGSGPLGDKSTDDKGHDLMVPPTEMKDLAASVGARGTRIFFGAWDPNAQPVGFMEQVMHVIPAARNAMPHGDFRQWDEIDEWARSIATELHSTLAAV
jgi:menaquinone-dependent protoporphyrinogen oxidase